MNIINTIGFIALAYIFGILTMEIIAVALVCKRLYGHYKFWHEPTPLIKKFKEKHGINK